jgi:leader peptidase (prepilin peptidase)/N-methyltransferase
MESINPEYLPFIWIAIVYNAFWIGGMLNVFIYRIPLMISRDDENAVAEYFGNELPHTDTYNLAWPPSACPHCSSKISYLQMIPVLAWIYMRGKCANCRKAVSIRYPIVELLCGLLITFAFVKYGLGDFWRASGLALLSVSLFCAAVIDAETKLLPDMITLGLLWTGLIFNVHGGFIPVTEAVYAAVATYVFFASTAWAFKRLRGIDGFGQGDIKLLTALAVWLGMVPLLAIAASAMVIFVGYYLLFVKDRQTKVPFGPFICVPALVAAWLGCV